VKAAAGATREKLMAAAHAGCFNMAVATTGSGAKNRWLLDSQATGKVSGIEAGLRVNGVEQIWRALERVTGSIRCT